MFEKTRSTASQYTSCSLNPELCDPSISTSVDVGAKSRNLRPCSTGTISSLRPCRIRIGHVSFGTTLSVRNGLLSRIGGTPYCHVKEATLVNGDSKIKA